MTWSYDPAESTAKDIIRGLVSDIDITDQLLANETIAAQLTRTPNVYWAAYYLAQRIARQLARLVTTKVGDTQVNYSDLAKHYALLSTDLRQTALFQGGGGMPYAGGLSQAEKTTAAEDTDRVAPAFTRRTLDDTPRSSVPGWEDDQ